MDYLEKLSKLEPKDFDDVINNLIDLFEEELCVELSESQIDKIEKVIEVCINYGLEVPKIKSNKEIKSIKNPNIRLAYILKKWLNSFVKKLFTPPSLKEGLLLSQKSTVEDPALRVILEELYYVNGYDSSDELIQTYIQNHEILMAIENTQGNLLEEYIAYVICREPYNFIWLDGEVVKATDFAYEEDDEIVLLQIKNKYNSENSSSKDIRNGTNIYMWYRLGKKTVNKKALPQFNWDELNAIVEELTDEKPDFSEENYQQFLKNIIKKNPKLISLI